MKRRKGFVSNSSSSSFVCGVCGGGGETWDWAWFEEGIARCQHFHVFHHSCAEEIIGDIFAEFIEDCKRKEDFDAVVPKWLCPLCMMVELGSSKFLRMIEKLTGLDRETILRKLREELE